MKANELMIGDWITMNSTTLQVTRLSKYGEYHNVDPIPLTPEILEKNGFSNNYTEDDLSYATDAGGDIIGVHIVAEKGVMDEMYFNYVHELQHALRLCGIDKEIVL